MSRLKNMALIIGLLLVAWSANAQEDTEQSETAAVSSGAEGIDPYEHAMEEIIVTPHWVELPEPEFDITPPLIKKSPRAWKIETHRLMHGNMYIKLARPNAKFWKTVCFEVREPNPLEFLDYGVGYWRRC
ncbi:MAG: hypothetical protein AAF512_25670 [Pseudomonadota bacterium]